VNTKDYPNLFEYMNYREFIGDTLETMKSKNPQFSFSAFAKKGGIPSRATITLVIQGKRNLTPESALLFAKALGLKATEKKYFLTLVDFQRAKTEESKRKHLAKIQNFVNRQQIFPLEKLQTEFFSQWYIPAIYVFVRSISPLSTTHQIADAFHGKVSFVQICKSLEILKNLGLLLEKEKKWEAKEARLTSSDEIKSIAIKEYHKSLLELAKKALSIPIEKREFGATTLPIHPKNLPILKQKIKQFREELIDELGVPQEDASVYQINIQAYPVTQKQRRKQ
tara:strand:- start:388 stop:1230 length:843 start_codon:yes stop_codon:yes gene_type:complete